MGTSLTGLTPSTTYDALIKVGDNGPLSATAKVLSDGLGNDSVLALSTTAVGIGTNAPGSILDINIPNTINTDLIRFSNSAGGSGDIAKFQYGPSGQFILNLLTNASANRPFGILNGNVGIGTTTPSDPLVVSSTYRDYTSAEFSTFLQSTTAQSVGRGGSIGFGGETGGGITSFGAIIGVKENSVFAETGGYLGLMSRSNAGPITEKARITSDGYLRMLSGTGGIQFNGDTAAANALDDYEEGTWTMGVAFGGASVGVTYSTQGGTYTKIGRQVTVNGFIILSSKGSSSGGVDITGLPFTSGNNTGNNTSASLWLFNVSFANQFQAIGNQNATTITLYETTEAGAVTGLEDTNFANDSRIAVNLTYFV
jgi:hypothetical protein